MFSIVNLLVSKSIYLVKSNDKIYVNKHIKNNDVTVDVIETDSVWYGVTYKEDKDSVQKAISNLISSGEYSSNLWGE